MGTALDTFSLVYVVYTAASYSFDVTIPNNIIFIVRQPPPPPSTQPVMLNKRSWVQQRTKTQEQENYKENTFFVLEIVVDCGVDKQQTRQSENFSNFSTYYCHCYEVGNWPTEN